MSSWYMLVYTFIYQYILVYTRIQCLNVAFAGNIVGRVPLIPLFLAGNSTPTIPHMFSKRKDSGFPFGCADAAAAD